MALGEADALGLTLGFGDGDLVLPAFVASLAAGLAEAEAVADGLGSSDGDGAIEGAMTTSGDGVGCGADVTLFLNQTK